MIYHDISWHFCITHHEISWQIITYHDISWSIKIYIMIYLDISWHIMTFCHKNKKHHFVAKACNYGIWRKFMITRFSIAFEDLLASSIAPQVVPHLLCLKLPLSQLEKLDGSCVGHNGQPSLLLCLFPQTRPRCNCVAPSRSWLVLSLLWQPWDRGEWVVEELRRR